MSESLEEAFATLRVRLLDARDVSVDPSYLDDAIRVIDAVIIDLASTRDNATR